MNTDELLSQRIIWVLKMLRKRMLAEKKDSLTMSEITNIIGIYIKILK